MAMRVLHIDLDRAGNCDEGCVPHRSTDLSRIAQECTATVREQDNNGSLVR